MNGSAWAWAASDEADVADAWRACWELASWVAYVEGEKGCWREQAGSSRGDGPREGSATQPTTRAALLQQGHPIQPPKRPGSDSKRAGLTRAKPYEICETRRG